MEPEAKIQKIDSAKNKYHDMDANLKVCNRILYRKSVLMLVKSKYKTQHLFTDTNSFDGKEYICKTCHSKVLKGCIPCQAVCNNSVTLKCRLQNVYTADCRP